MAFAYRSKITKRGVAGCAGTLGIEQDWFQDREPQALASGQPNIKANRAGDSGPRLTLRFTHIF